MLLDSDGGNDFPDNLKNIISPGQKDRFRQQIEFILEVDKLKNVLRKTILMDRSRRENSAEHSWHLAMSAMILAEHAADSDFDVLHAVKLALVHDLIEIDAGDTYCYDDEGRKDQKQREAAAADRIFSLLPADQKRKIHRFWEEFEHRQTPEARFAHAVDRFVPLLHNYVTAGSSWKENGIRRTQVEKRMASIRPGSEVLHAAATALINEAVRRGFLSE